MLTVNASEMAAYFEIVEETIISGDLAERLVLILIKRIIVG